MTSRPSHSLLLAAAIVACAICAVAPYDDRSDVTWREIGLPGDTNETLQMQTAISTSKVGKPRSLIRL
jgi:hypothetical protein